MGVPGTDHDRLLKVDEVAQRVGAAKATIYRWMDADFPRPLKLGTQMCRWWCSEVDAWLATRGRGGKRQASPQEPEAPSVLAPTSAQTVLTPSTRCTRCA